MNKIQTLVILGIAFFLLNSREEQTSDQGTRELIFENSSDEQTFPAVQKKAHQAGSIQYASLTTIPEGGIVESNKPAVIALKNQVEQVIENYKVGLSETNKRLEEDREELDETLKRAGKDISPKSLTVLSIDGGGARGLMPAKWLEYIEQKSVTNMRIDQLFDYIGGTSIGGILALGVSPSTDNTTRLLETSDLVNLFKKHGREIFPRNFKVEV